MREIKYIGRQVRSDGRKYHCAVFQCDECGEHVEKIRRDGKKALFCSYKCSAKNRKRRGPYKSGVMISGYRYVQQPEHPFATKKGYVAEHRLVAESIYGGPIPSGLDVHHINGERLDNRVENLAVLTKSEHMKLHKQEAKRNESGKFSV